MRPSVQKTLLVALGAALLSSALGVSGTKVGATAKDQPVRIVVLPGRAPGAPSAGGEFDRLLQNARIKRVIGELGMIGPGAKDEAADPAAPYSRAELLERVRQRLLAQLRQDRR